MKKFSRALIFILSLIALVTAFTVAALAADEAVLVPKTTGGFDFEDKTAGDVFNDNPSKLGKWVVASADNGNVYVSSSYESATGTNGDNWDISVTDALSYHLSKYPTLAFDFDVMSSTGSFHWSATIRTDLYGGDYSARITQMGSYKLNSDGISLKNVANLWQHVTYIVKYEGNGIFGFYFYVDGEATKSFTVDYNASTFSSKDKRYTFTNWNDVYDDEGNLVTEGLADENDNIKLKKLAVAVVSMYSPYRDTTGGELISYDNLKFTYYPESYSLDDVASHIYNDDYQMPYGITEATITDNETGEVTWYDDFDKAFADANENNTLTIKKQITGSYEINKAMNVDMNGFTLDYFSKTGYIPTVEGNVYKFALSDKLAQVVWDPVCSDEVCDCYGGVIGHELTDSALVALGFKPDYKGETLINKEGVVAKLLGWSYTKDGEVQEINPEEGTLKVVLSMFGKPTPIELEFNQVEKA